MKLCLLMFVLVLSGKSGAVQSAASVQRVNKSIIADFHAFVKMQGSDPQILRAAVAEVTPYLDPNDDSMAGNLIYYVEGTKNEKARFLVLNSLGRLSEFQDGSAFGRLVSFYLRNSTSSSDRTSASNSIRAAIRTGKPSILRSVAIRVILSENQQAVADSIFFFGQDKQFLIATSWYLPWLMRKVIDYSASSLQVRANAFRELTYALSDEHGALVPGFMQTVIYERLLFALQTEPDNAVKRDMIIRIGEKLPIGYFSKTLMALKDSSTDPNIKSSAERALAANNSCEVKLELIEVDIYKSKIEK